ncbi:MFS transporter [Nocardiopsis sp. CT-R113]|uniref:MFS transporter n=1 Tax=Nocardiopsis codii TaxID=3065942 RepID=A0ABU7KB56_9ACTN|nr:MFS transporter [Nocardiopsis sp. CT-R113]MEE2038802.1 MFS transporter [Nocardiopsis sp. CT-R113]
MPGYLRFLHSNRRWLVGGFALFLMSAFGQTFFVSLFAGDIRAEYGLSHGEFGSLFMFATLASALALTQIGSVVDRSGSAGVVFGVFVFLAAGAVAMALSAHVVALFGALFLLRLFGQGMMTHTSFTLMGRWFGRERGRATSVATLGLNTGEALLPLAVVSLVALVGWRGTWWAAVVLLLVLAWPVAALMRAEREPAPVSEEGPGLRARDWTRRQTLRDPCFYLVAAAMAAPALVGNTVFFHQVYLVESRGWAPAAFATAFTVYAVTTVVFNLVGGQLVDRFSAMRLVPVYLLPLGVGLFVLAAVPGQWGAFAFMALYGVTNGLSLSLFGAVWPEIYGITHLGSIRSVIVAIMVFASAAGPGTAGLLIDAGVPYPAQLAALGGYCVVVSAVMARTIPFLRTRVLSQSVPVD